MAERRKSQPGVPGAVVERKSGRVHRDHALEERAADLVELSDIEDDFEDEDFSETRDVNEIPGLRETRPDHLRFRHIERNQDELRREMKIMRSDVNKVQVAVADISGQMKVVPDLVEAMKDATSAMRLRDHVTLTAKVEVDKAEKLAEVKVGEAKKIDNVQAGAAKREWITKGFALLSSIVAIISTAIAAGRC